MMRRFDLSSVTFDASIDQEYHIPVHEIQIAGLSERRPSVMPNDVV